MGHARAPSGPTYGYQSRRALSGNGYASAYYSTDCHCLYLVTRLLVTIIGCVCRNRKR